MLVFATGDNKQIKPIRGNTVWNSNLLLTSHDICYLNESVRCGDDAYLKEILQLSRKENLTEEELDRIVKCLEDGIPEDNFVPNWDSLGDPYIFKIVSTNAAMRAADKAYIANKLKDRVAFFLQKAQDECREGRGGKYYPAESTLCSAIDEQYQENAVRELHIFEDTVMALTYNNINGTEKTPKFSKNQFMHITEIPSDRNNFHVVGRLIKIGSAEKSGGYAAIKLPMHQFKEFEYKSGLTKCFLRRVQYPLRHNNCSTIHRTIGATLPAVATQITSKSDDKKYHIWQKEMLVVLLSRCRKLSHMKFIGSQATTLANCREIFSQRNDLAHYIEGRLRTLDVLRLGDQPRIVQAYPQTIFPEMFKLPCEDAVGFVGLLVSRPPDGLLFEVIFCQSLVQEIKLRNTTEVLKVGAHFKPYFIPIFLFGFPEGQDGVYEMLSFCNRMSDKIKSIKRVYGDAFTWQHAVHLFSSFHRDYLVHSNAKIVLVHCVNLTLTGDEFTRFCTERNIRP